MIERTMTRWGPILCVTLAVACQSGTAPRDVNLFDAGATNTQLQVIDDVLTGAAWESFRVLGPRFSVGQDAAAAAARLPHPAYLHHDSHTPSDLADLSYRLATGAAVPRIPFDIRGTTFVLDPESGRYVPDPDRPGAPANGVRFILYALNPITGQPIVDTEVGHADLTDEGDDTASGIALRLEVVSEGTTFLDYAVATEGDEETGSLSVEGFVGGPDTRLDFSIEATGRQNTDGRQMDVAFRFDIDALDFHVRGALGNVETADGTAGTVDLTVTAGATTIEFEARGSAETIDATFTVNDNLFATVTGHPRDPIVRGADGAELSGPERETLGRIMQLQHQVFAMLSDLLQPVEAILSLRMIP